MQCIDNGSNDYWTTLEDTCEPTKCSGGENVGSARVKEGAFCPNGVNGTVMEYCDENGNWVEVTNNCVTGVCEAPIDNKGNAFWPTTIAGTLANYMSCIPGYEPSGGTPTRQCNSNGTWSDAVNNHCTRIQCQTVPTANYNGTLTTDDDANYPVTYAGETNVSALSCQGTDYDAPAGYPIADCDITGMWSNERVNCKYTAPPDTCFNDGPVMGKPLCPSGNIPNVAANYGCARMIGVKWLQ